MTDEEIDDPVWDFWTYWDLREKQKLRHLIDVRGFSLNQEILEKNNIESEFPPIYYAIQRSAVEFVDFFLEMGADVNYIPRGISCLFSLNKFKKADIQILKLLLDAGVLFLPHFPTQKTVLDVMDEGLAHYTRRIQEIRSEIMLTIPLAIELERCITRKQILTKQRKLVLPYFETFVKTLRIDSPSGPLGELKIDARATVKLVKMYITSFFFENSMSIDDFSLIMPSFQHPNLSKKRMEDERALTDYNVQNNTRLIVIPRLRTELEGGRRKTRRRQRRRKNI